MFWNLVLRGLGVGLRDARFRLEGFLCLGLGLHRGLGGVR